MQRTRILAALLALLLAAAPVCAAPQKPASPAELAAGKAVYDKSCGMCHNTGLAGAPKLGDKAVWKDHLHDGLDHMVKAAIEGKGKMPAKGGNAKLTDAEVRNAVLYMMQQSK